MKNKYTMLLVAAVLAAALCAGCRRPTPHDIFLPDPNCKKLGYDSGNYTSYYDLSYTYSMYATLDTTATITSISANFHGSTTAIAMIYDSSLNLIVQSAPASVSDGWNKIPVQATALPPGTYRMAVAFAVYSGNGIRLESGKGTTYLTSYGYPTAYPNVSGSLSANFGLLVYGNYCP